MLSNIPSLTPALIAERLSIDDDTVRGWLATRQLRGVNVAKSPTAKKPRWRISEADLQAFLDRRASGGITQPQPTPRRRAAAGNVIEFF